LAPPVEFSIKHQGLKCQLKDTEEDDNVRFNNELSLTAPVNVMLKWKTFSSQQPRCMQIRMNA